MKKITLKPSHLEGKLNKIYSKSYAHRFIFAFFLAGGNWTESMDKGFEKISSTDISTTLNMMKTLHSFIKNKKNNLANTESINIQCNNSGTSLRIGLPILSSICDNCVFYIKSQLFNRELDFSALLQKDISLGETNIHHKFNITQLNGKINTLGLLQYKNYEILDTNTSQLISGLLMASPLQKDDVYIKISKDTPSLPYIFITLDIMKRFSVDVTVDYFDDIIKFSINKNQKYKLPKDYHVSTELDTDNNIKMFDKYIPCDASNISIWLVYNFLFNIKNKGQSQITTTYQSFLENIKNQPIKLPYINLDNKQGDLAIFEILENIYQAHIRNLPIYIDCINNPDLFPILAICAGLTNGLESYFTGLSNLKYKESNRLQATLDILRELEIPYRLEEQNLYIKGISKGKGKLVDTQNDHRLIMAATIASCFNNYPLELVNASDIEKSYPHFWIDYEKLAK